MNLIFKILQYKLHIYNKTNKNIIIWVVSALARELFHKNTEC